MRATKKKTFRCFKCKFAVVVEVELQKQTKKTRVREKQTDSTTTIAKGLES